MLLRSAYLLGADAVFTVGRRFRKGRAGVGDTLGAANQLELNHFATVADMLAAMPAGAVLVGVEKGGADLQSWSHPARAIYLLGSEDEGLPSEIMKLCTTVVELRTARRALALPSGHSNEIQDSASCWQPGMLNVHVAGALTLYHRATQLGQLTCGSSGV